jgi:site-specific DNA-methyltransferase (adenine-specific)
VTVQLIHGDCLEHMAAIPAASVDLVVADPPYGQTQNAWDSVIPLDDLWAAVWRVCKPHGAVVMTAIQPFSSRLVMSQVKAFRHEWVWEKNKATGHLNAKRAPMRAHELVLVFCRQQPRYFPQMTDGHRPGNFATRRTYTPNYGAQTPTEYGGSTKWYPRSVQPFAILNNDNPEKVHPTQKPVELMEYFVRTYSAPGDVVLDFSMGSGTTGVAAVSTDRSFVGIEKSPEYMAAATRRVALAEALR